MLVLNLLIILIHSCWLKAVLTLRKYEYFRKLKFWVSSHFEWIYIIIRVLFFYIHQKWVCACLMLVYTNNTVFLKGCFKWLKSVESRIIECWTSQETSFAINVLWYVISQYYTSGILYSLYLFKTVQNSAKYLEFQNVEKKIQKDIKFPFL